jgi:hypothetical protein
MRAWELIRSDSDGNSKPTVIGLFSDKDFAIERLESLPDSETLQLVERELADGAPKEEVHCSRCGGGYAETDRGSACASCGHRWP